MLNNINIEREILVLLDYIVKDLETQNTGFEEGFHFNLCGTWCRCFVQTRCGR